MSTSIFQPLADWSAAYPLQAAGVAVLLTMLAAAAFWKLAAGEGARRQRIVLFCLFAILSCGVFLALAVDVHGNSGIVVFDRALAQDIAASMDPGALRVLSVFTHLGDRNWLIVLSALMLLALAWRRRWVLAGGWVGATLGAAVLNVLLKRGFERLRPEHVEGFAQAHGFSFPSGHASGSVAVYGMLCYLCLRAAPPRSRLPVLLVSVALITAIGASRVLLRAHFFSDVVAGWAVTSIWLALAVAATERLSRRPKPCNVPQHGA